MKAPYILILFFLAFASFLQAQIQVTTNSTAPDKDIIWTTQPEAPLSNFNWNGVTSRRDLGFSFKATNNSTFNALTLKLAATNAAALGADFSLRIFETTNYNIVPTTGILKSEVYGSLPAIMAVGNFITFQLDDIVPVTSNKFYNFVLSYSNVIIANNKSLGFTVGTGSILDSQTWYSDNTGTSWTRDGGKKTLMYVTIPEPGVLSLLSLALLVPLFFYKRKRSMQI